MAASRRTSCLHRRARARLGLGRVAGMSLMLLAAWPAAGEGGSSATDYLFKAIAYRGLSDVKALIDQGANVNARAPGGRTPLMVLASEGSDLGTLINLFVISGADVNARSDTGLTALMCASFYRKKNTVRVLLEGGAEVNARDAGGLTPLMHAARSASCEDAEQSEEEQTALLLRVLDILLEEGANPLLQDSSGRTVLMHAMMAGQPGEVMRFLRREIENRSARR